MLMAFANFYYKTVQTTGEKETARGSSRKQKVQLINDLCLNF